jgi:hypothetical protein
MSDYRTEVKEAIEEYMNDNEWAYNMADYTDVEDFEQHLYDDMFIADEITGNASGSYFCNSNEAKEAVLYDMGTVREALIEFGCSAEEIGDRFLNEDWEWLDVTARCYVLGEALGDWIRDHEEAIEKAIEEANAEFEDSIS